ncbi:MAG: metallophosphoesterase [Planctomycetia bacterium]|nr:metallophosphoesterase [Planctomycetia bacterium]
MLNRRETFKLFASGMTAGIVGATGMSTFAGTENGNENGNAEKPLPDFPVEKDAWTMVVIPDPQSYVKYGRNQGILELMTAWIAENVEKYRIKQVLVTGDLVEQNNMGVGQYNQTSKQMWEAVSRAFTRLDGVIPYIVCTGNHDYGIRSAENRETQLNTYFPVEKNPLWKDTLVEMGVNTFGQKTLENAAYEFTTPAGQKMLTISLPFAPPDESLAWARELAARKCYENHFVTVLTHSYIDGTGKRREKEGYQLNKMGGNAGEGIWQKFVKQSPNVKLVVSGHFSGTDSWEKSAAFSLDMNDAGKPVAQMLFDTQALGGGWEGNGGDGWIRLVEFSADMKTMKARTFSPAFHAFPGLRAQAWERSERNQFTYHFE